jgi:hypothetical protein
MYVCMYLTNIITRPLYQYKYQFAICESCLWCATVFHKSIIIKQEQQEYLYQTSGTYDESRQY